MMLKRSSVLGLMMMVALAACGESTTEPPPQNEFPRMRGGQVLFQYVPSANTPAITSIAVAGSFGAEGTDAFWNPGNANFQMTRQANGRWELTRPLPAGNYEYKFVFNGDQWAQHMCNDATWGNPAHGGKVDPAVTQCNEDPFGGANAILVVQ
jgi:hypothetical protein